MNLYRAALLASVATALLWTLKAVVIAVSGEGNSVAESVLFLAGLLASVVAALLVGAAIFAARSVPWRVLGSLVSFVAVALIGTAVQLVVVRLKPVHPAWWWGELNLWVIALALLVAAMVVARIARREDPRDRTRRPRARAGARPVA